MPKDLEFFSIPEGSYILDLAMGYDLLGMRFIYTPRINFLRIWFEIQYIIMS